MSIEEIASRHQKALRYMNNAREILNTKAGKEDEYYQDAKYVKKACGVAYKAALLALNAYLEIKGKIIRTKGVNLNAKDYLWALSDDRDIYNYYNDTWNLLYCNGCHNGILIISAIDEGMKAADAIINAIRPAA